MKAKISLLLLLVAAAQVHAGDPLKDARATLLKGNYTEAREAYEELLKNDKHLPAAAIGVSQCWLSIGDYDKALDALAAALKKQPKNADLLARHAEVLYLRGRLDEAEKSARAAVDLAEEHFLARWILGQITRDRGDSEKAVEEFRWFVRTYTRRDNDGMEITDPDELIWVGLAAIEYARYHRLTDQFGFVLKHIFRHSVETDKLFWPGDYQAGRLLQEKHNKADAAKALDRALAINPRAAEALVVKGEAALQRFEIKDAENFAQQALDVNPNLPEALRLRADVFLFSGEIKKALADLETARKVNGRAEATLARIAGCYFQMRDKAGMDKIIKDMHAFNPKPGVFYYELAECLEQRKLYKEAEKYYQLSIDHQPKLPWALGGLGQLYMRLGKETEAHKILEDAFSADEFNVRLRNTLQVLKHLKGYDTLKTKHFHIRYDPKNDKILANFLGKYLEDIYDELAPKFDYRPEGPILIEVFNKHEMFSGRVVALPDLHTIGACTGRMVAMVSPRDKQRVITKPFNWMRVMRHELVHVFNLEQTDFRIPHWFTEGLAVTLEGYPTPPRWHYLLAEKLQANDLLNLDNILLAFVRPRTPDQWQQAYLQSQLYVEYLTKTHGDKAIGKLLAAYAEDLPTEAALKKAVGVTKEEFEKGYRAFLEQRVPKDIKAAAEKPQTLKALKEAYEKDPKDADLVARLADRYFSVGNRGEAKKLADEALGLKRYHPVAVYVKANLMLDGGDPDTAYDFLKTAVDEKVTETKTMKLLIKLHLEKKNLADAAALLERCRKQEPFEITWLAQLAKAYEVDPAKLIPVLKDLAQADTDDLGIRKKLAKLLADANNHAEAERYARDALFIDVLDRTAQDLLLAALTAQNKDEEAKQMRKLLERE